MENSFRDNREFDILSYKSTRANENNKENEIVSTPRSKRISSPKRKYKNSRFQKKFSIVEGLQKANDDNIKRILKSRKTSLPENIRKQLKKMEDKKIEKRDSEKGQSKKKERANKKKKKEKRMDSPKKKKDTAANEKIKVVGTVSARLNALIQRLGQNSDSNGKNANQNGEKVVMAPRIKAALEKFNKKNEEKPEIMHFPGNSNIKKKNTSNEENNNKKHMSKGGYNYDEGKDEENNEEEGEYEEDEDYEEEDEEEEEEEKQQEKKKVVKRRNTKKKKKKRKRKK